MKIIPYLFIKYTAYGIHINIYILIINNWCKTMHCLQRSIDDVMCLRSDELRRGFLPTVWCQPEG